MEAKKIVLCVVMVCCIVALVGCYKSPRCSDKEVKRLALDISKELIWKKIYPHAMVPIAQCLDNLPKNNPVSQKIELSMYGRGEKVTLKELKTVNHPDVQKIVSGIESNFQKTRLDMVRTSSEDKKVKKCNCEADVVMEDLKIPITYEAQTTDEGQIRVEVQLR